MRKRGQVSTEYLMMTGILLIVLTFIVLYSLNRVDDTIKIHKISQSLDTMKKAMDAVVLLGPGNKEVVTIDLPKGIRSIGINDTEVVVIADIFGRPSDFHIGSIPGFNITGAMGMQEGYHHVIIEMQNSTHVRIRE